MHQPPVTHPASPDDPPIYAELARTYLNPQTQPAETHQEATGDAGTEVTE
jgi:hypothetical protein